MVFKNYSKKLLYVGNHFFAIILEIIQVLNCNKHCYSNVLGQYFYFFQKTPLMLNKAAFL